MWRNLLFKCKALLCITIVSCQRTNCSPCSFLSLEILSRANKNYQFAFNQMKLQMPNSWNPSLCYFSPPHLWFVLRRLTSLLWYHFCFSKYSSFIFILFSLHFIYHMNLMYVLITVLHSILWMFHNLHKNFPISEKLAYFKLKKNKHWRFILLFM